MKALRYCLPVALIAFILWACFALLHHAQLKADEAAQRALVAEASVLIAKHHDVNGAYPKDLRDLPLTFPDGGSQEMLDDIDYVRDIDSFSLETTGYSTGRAIVYESTANKMLRHQDQTRPETKAP